jgi:hypothetical protein
MLLTCPQCETIFRVDRWLSPDWPSHIAAE